MIKLKHVLCENSVGETKKEGYVIQQNWVGYDSWHDETGVYDNIERAKKAYDGWVGGLRHYNKDKALLRLVKRTIIIREEIIEQFT